MTPATPSFIAILIDATIKSTLILSGVVLVSFFLRRASASIRHFVWALGLGGVLVLPFLSLVLPHLPVSIPTHHVYPNLQTLPEADNSKISPISAPKIPQSDHPSNVPAPISTMPDTPIPIAIQSTRQERSRFPSSVAILSVWLLGVIFVLAQWVQGSLTLRRIAQKSVLVTDGPMQSLLASGMQVMQNKRHIRLIIASSDSIITVPLTYGAIRPAIVLPTSARDWPEARMRAVFLHELAHVRRSDWLLQVLSVITCTLYWFHPLVWLAARKMRTESENACDDLVLIAGLPATEYAHHLLDVALSSRRNRAIGSASVAMAQNSKIENRLKAILAIGTNRKRLAWKRAAILTIITFLFVAPFAAIRLGAKASLSPDSQIATSEQRLSTGGKIQLVGISSDDVPGRIWWNSSSKQIPRPLYRNKIGVTIQMKHLHTFIFNVSGIRSGADFVSDFGTSIFSVMLPISSENHRATLNIIAAVPTNKPNCLMRIGVASVDWKVLLSKKPNALNIYSTHVMVGQHTVIFSQPSTVKNQLTFTVTDDILDQDTRIVALDSQAHSTIAKEGIAQASKTTRQRIVQFSGIKSTEIKELQFQTRAYEWVEFRNIPLQPASASVSERPNAILDPQIKILRTHLQSWAQINTVNLQQMSDAQPNDLPALMRVYDSLQHLPFPLWESDPRIGHGNDSPSLGMSVPRNLTLTHLQNSQEPLVASIRRDFAHFHDFRLAQSMNAGYIHTTLWASGRITQSTIREQFVGHGKPFQRQQTEIEIVPAFSKSLISELQRAVQADPNNADAQYQLGQALSNSIHWVHHTAPPVLLNDAIQHLQRAVDLQPDNPNAVFDLAVCLDNANRGEVAWPLYEKYQSLLSPWGLPNGTRYHEKNRVKKEAVIETDLLMGRLFLRMHRYDASVAHFRRAIEQDQQWGGEFTQHPGTINWSDLYLNLGNAQNSRGWHSEARFAWKKAVAIGTQRPYWHHESEQAQLMLTTYQS